MTDEEATRHLRRQYKCNAQAKNPEKWRKYVRMTKLRSRYKGPKLKAEIARTKEKLEMLLAIAQEPPGKRPPGRPKRALLNDYKE